MFPLRAGKRGSCAFSLLKRLPRRKLAALQTIEIVAHAAWCRRENTMIEKTGRDWVKEATACGKNSDPRFEGFMVSLYRAFSLLGGHKIASHTETLLLRHPESSFHSAPWKAWLGGTLQMSGVVLYRELVERVPVLSLAWLTVASRSSG
jgi:hypothetical protein